MITISKITKTQQNVKVLVKQFPFLKDNYNLLVAYYWKEIESAKTFDHVAICTSAESITRAFRKLVETGDIVLNKDTKKTRKQMEKEFREKYKKTI